MDKLLFKKILVSALTALALIYVVYLLISANFNLYPTENAIQTTVTETIYTKGFIIRDENIIYNDTSGVLSYSCKDGEEVKAGGEIAKVYTSESDAVSKAIADSLEAQKQSLQSLQKTNVSGTIGIDTINNDINNKMINYLNDINNCEISSVSEDTDALLSAINLRQLYTGKITSFDSEIANLQSQIDELNASSGDSIGTITTEKAGYFSEVCDGYENSINYKDIDKMSLSDLNNIQKSSTDSNYAGKITSSLNWYVACEVTADEATNLTLWGENMVSILFADASTEPIPAYVHRIQQDSKDSNALVILSCDYMDAGLIETRQEPIEIGLGTYTGLRVSRRAIHDDYVTKTTYDDDNNIQTEKKKVQGVYVLYGSEVQFKQISILYSDEDYVICDSEPDPGILFNGETVSMYDQVIVKGDDLYDGKVIE